MLPPANAVGFTCPKCRTWREPDQCYWKPDGVRQGWCRTCTNADASARHARTYQPKPLRSATCQWCQASFETKRDSRRYCSRRCNDLRRGVDQIASRRARPTRSCEACGTVLAADKRADAKWCSPTCEATRPARRASVRRSRLKTSYGLTPETFEAMLAAQRGRCAVCGGSDPKHTNWSVDHDHVTGQVRGILCSRCNTGIGQLQDDPDIIKKAWRYIQSHRQMVLPLEGVRS